MANGQVAIIVFMCNSTHSITRYQNMAITLQVVGIFFKADLDLPPDTNVLTVLKQASFLAGSGKIQNVSQFDFTLAESGGVSSFRVKYQNPFQGREVTPPRTYPAGEYYLSENLNSSPSYNVWQYYVVDANGTNIIRGIKFPSDPAATVPGGGKLIWRLVNILAGPASAPAAAERALLNRND